MKKHIPNIITCCNLICGCIATGAALPANYFWAIIFILLGAIFDFFDGLVARALGVSSPVGKELDSLADVVTFGVAPSAMLFSLFQEVQYPEFMLPLRNIMPYTAFIMAAFSALRLAKFNLDTRQSTSFIGLPTPANALFWGSLILGQHAFLVSGRFNAFFLFLFMLLFCFLLVAELPLFALKFKNLSWKDNNVKYIFLLGCIPCFMLVESSFAAIILWYVALSIIAPTISSSKDYD
ncbi:MAG: CDP-diacylglycerol--serine O-phosphatidyltransferase [Bacteroidaceae bacterium]|nr:CDP-diacylglycerol--serine O-phosphatidyltransferase [Bacteroidaceae bacterium]